MLSQISHFFVTNFGQRWSKRRQGAPTSNSHSQVTPRPCLTQLAKLPAAQLPTFVRESVAAMKYRELLGMLDWAAFPERPTTQHWRGPTPEPMAPFAAAYLIKLEKGLRSIPKLREYLVENPALVWLLGFPLQPSDEVTWGFDAHRSLPSARHLIRGLHQLRPSQVRFLLQNTVQLLKAELPADAHFGYEISLDTKHILAWVKENNPKVYIEGGRFHKEKQPKGDLDCKLGCKRKHNQGRENDSLDSATNTPTTEGMPASQARVGEYYWGYGSGIVATKVEGVGEFVLAELTQPFDQSDVSYFYPLMTQTEQHLGFAPPFGALDAAFDAFYVYEYFHRAGGFAAVPLRNAQESRAFDGQGLPLCAAGLVMPLKSTYTDSTHLFPHQRGRYVCPLTFPLPTHQPCPLAHANAAKGGCIATFPTSIGTRLRQQLDRSGAEYQRIFAQRTASERINSQALDLGIERPKLRNQRSIANQNTLIYVLINLRALQRLRQRKTNGAALV